MRCYCYRGHDVEIEEVEPGLFVYFVDGNIGGEQHSQGWAERAAESLIDNLESYSRAY